MFFRSLSFLGRSSLWKVLACGLMVAGSLTACQTGNDDDDDASAGTQDVTIRFVGRVGAQPFFCGQTYSNLGSTKTSAEPLDFRFYVNNVRLVDSNGKEVAVVLNQDGKWQQDQLALIDLENKAGACNNGTTETNDSVIGKVPKGTYRAIRFTLGVPFEKNHQDAAKAASPLNVSAMFWIWNSGYKFLKLDIKTPGLTSAGLNGFNIHLGSTACSPSTPKESAPTTCANGNRPEIELTGFDPSSNTIIADLATLVQDTNLDVNQANSAPGCMSGVDDGDCAKLFPRLGLAFSGQSPLAQTFFRVQ